MPQPPNATAKTRSAVLSQVFFSDPRVFWANQRAAGFHVIFTEAGAN
jgi:hypothetical protein